MKEPQSKRPRRRTTIEKPVRTGRRLPDPPKIPVRSSGASFLERAWANIFFENPFVRIAARPRPTSPFDPNFNPVDDPRFLEFGKYLYLLTEVNSTADVDRMYAYLPRLRALERANAEAGLPERFIGFGASFVQPFPASGVARTLVTKAPRLRSGSKWLDELGTASAKGAVDGIANEIVQHNVGPERDYADSLISVFGAGAAHGMFKLLRKLPTSMKKFGKPGGLDANSKISGPRNLDLEANAATRKVSQDIESPNVNVPDPASLRTGPLRVDILKDTETP